MKIKKTIIPASAIKILIDNFHTLKLRHLQILPLFVFTLFLEQCHAQNSNGDNFFTHADTLRGSITPERSWWNVLRYDITVKPDFAEKKLQGFNIITFNAKQYPESPVMQIDMQVPMSIDSIFFGNERLKFKRAGNAYMVNLPKRNRGAMTGSVKAYFSGKPKESIKPPWDGGWIFTKDTLNRPWMTVACEGFGASCWYPNKDYLGDEPDSGASLSIIVPDTLIGVGNGRLQQKVDHEDGTTTYKWAVVNPINNYDIVPYVGKYTHWHDIYHGERGNLDCDYWVMDYNLKLSKIKFLAVDSMLKCFEYWFGPYPFYEDSYKLVEAPHLGMEHQSAIAYGNKFRQGYSGKDLSETGRGLNWDFIIVHESGHEWFGNNITAKDIADEWIHEGFTNYSETLYIEFYFGREAAEEYLFGLRKLIRNDFPIIGRYGVNNEPEDTDQYYKAGNMIHMIRHIIADDSLFRKILRGLNKEFYHQTVTTKQIEDYISRASGIDFSKVFDQYLRTTKIPVLEYKIHGHDLSFRWTNCIKGFKMPVDVNIKGPRRIKPTEQWQKLSFYPEGNFALSVDRNFYIGVTKVD
ncbi:MAG: peptidase M1 [Bacteroidetes bacterium]|nr:MAG: peptidase M1 [Bacteroidota bacterium]